MCLGFKMAHHLKGGFQQVDNQYQAFASLCFGSVTSILFPTLPFFTWFYESDRCLHPSLTIWGSWLGSQDSPVMGVVFIQELAANNNNCCGSSCMSPQGPPKLHIMTQLLENTDKVKVVPLKGYGWQWHNFIEKSTMSRISIINFIT